MFHKRISNKYKFKKINIKFRFLFIGLVNVFLSNILLQIIIFIFPLWLSTFLSQIFNIILGYFTYSRFVFKVINFKITTFLKYLIFVIMSWNLNAFLIAFFIYSLNFNIRLSAILPIPILAMFSYFLQKKFIFKN